jgi:hypothetical protein
MQLCWKREGEKGDTFFLSLIEMMEPKGWKTFFTSSSVDSAGMLLTKMQELRFLVILWLIGCFDLSEVKSLSLLEI